MTKNFVVYGAGGSREHAIARQAGNSPVVDKIYASHLTAGISNNNIPGCVQMPAFRGLDMMAKFCKNNSVGTFFIGPEAPLEENMAGFLRQRGVSVFGPNADAARLETSKWYAYEFMQRHGVPTAETHRHTTFASIVSSIDTDVSNGEPIVVKYDGLMGGKGVTVHTEGNTKSSALAAAEKLYDGEPSATVLLAEYLSDSPDMPRSELSVHVLVAKDGSYIILPPIQDYKPRFDDDTGRMTGGMGCHTFPLWTPEMEREIDSTIIKPTCEGILADGMTYQGVLYFSLKRTPDGWKVIEYNVRFGDPEMVILAELFDDDPMPVFAAIANGESLKGVKLQFKKQAVVGVVIVNKAYPDKGPSCEFPRELLVPGLYHAATKPNGNTVAADGGRIATIVGVGANLTDAFEAVYGLLSKVEMPGELDYRTDIGLWYLK